MNVNNDGCRRFTPASTGRRLVPPANGDCSITQETAFPRGDHSRLTIGGAGPLAINLRVPAWAVRGFTVTVNGVAQNVQASPGSYLTLSRTWAPGDAIDVSMPFSIRIERAIDRPDTQSVFWGPVLMPILGNPGGGAYRELTLYQFLKLDGDYSRAAITLAGTSPGHDGLTFLDVVWDQAPFANHGQFVSAVTHVAADFAARGLFTLAQESAVVSAAARARAQLAP